MTTYHSLQDLVLGNGGITNVTFIVGMRPIRVCGLVAYTTSSDEIDPPKGLDWCVDSLKLDD